MKKIKILVFIFVLGILMAETVTMTTQANSKKTIEVYVAIDRTMIGQGYLLEPTRIEIAADSSMLDVIQKMEKMTGLKIETTSEGVSGIEYADKGKLNISPTIQKMNPVEYTNLVTGMKEKYIPPTNFSTNPLYSKKHTLGTGSYHPKARWDIEVNNVQYPEKIDSERQALGNRYVLDNQYVIVLNFVVYFDKTYYVHDSAETMEWRTIPTDKSDLIRQVAVTDKSGVIGEIRKKTIRILENYDATQKQVNDATSLLKKINSNSADIIKPNKDIISIVKKEYNSKKIKVRLKKEPYAVKYQIQLSKTKKFKNPIMTRTTNKRYASFNNKKLMKKKKLYMRVRVIKKQKGIVFRTRWTSPKKVTITKKVKVRYKINGKWTKPKNKKVIL